MEPLRFDTPSDYTILVLMKGNLVGGGHLLVDTLVGMDTSKNVEFLPILGTNR